MNNTTYNKIFFDFDSTLVKVESLDSLGEMLGVGEKVRAITEATMSGSIPFEHAFKEKIGILSPSKQSVDKVAEECTHLFVDGALETIKKLQDLNKEVYIISSNFHQIILPSAKILNIPEENILANEFYFNPDGSYAGFSENDILNTQGKKEAIKKFLNPEDLSVLIGDGAIDLGAKDSVGLFIGFGGVVEREIVKQNADVFVTDSNLLSLLPYMITTPTPTTTLQYAVG